MKESDNVYPVVGEITESYRVFDLADGGILVIITVPKEFTDIFLVKMTDLTVTQEEIDQFC